MYAICYFLMLTSMVQNFLVPQAKIDTLEIDTIVL